MNLIYFTLFLCFFWNFYQMKVLGYQEFVLHQGYEYKKDLINEWTVEIEGSPEVAELIALEFGYIYGGEVLGFPDTYIFRKDEHAMDRRSQFHHQVKRLTNDIRVRWAEQLFDKSRVKRETDDPDRPLDRIKRRKHIKKNNDELNEEIRHKRHVLGKPLFNDELWGHEWYLQDTRTNLNLPRLDLNVLPVYRLGINGTGIRITVLDDGLEHSHTDLKDNYDPEISWDCNDSDPDPSPRYEERNLNSHGTRCAGEIAMTANNFKCGVGVAFGAKVGGVRMLDGRVTDRVEGEALGYAWDKVDIYSASWGPNDDGRTVEGPGRLATAAMLRGVTKGRGGKGIIYVWANGNGGSRRDNCNCDGYSSNIYTVSIASASQQGLFPWYGEICASTLATAYSSGAYTDQKIATTDTGDACTLRHTGTSAAAPLAAGIIALMLQANPTLTWRDVQHIIVWNSEYMPLAANDGWQMNNAGLRFDVRFGFGLLNAEALVLAALNWTTVPEKRECIITSTQNNNISLSNAEHVEILFQADDCLINFVEHVELYVNIAYTRRGALQIYLASPHDTTVNLLSFRPLDKSDAGFSNWPLTSVATWGENPKGVWKASFLDETKEYNQGVIGPTKLVIHGTEEMPNHMKTGPRNYKFYSSSDSQEFWADNVGIDKETTKDETEHIEELLAEPKQDQNNILENVNPTILAEIEQELLRIHHRMTKYSRD